MEGGRSRLCLHGRTPCNSFSGSMLMIRSWILRISLDLSKNDCTSAALASFDSAMSSSLSRKSSVSRESCLIWAWALL
ncbi:MAG: META domain-containing protein [Verrucomicrobiae bacterium]|nr:META domain-containing protein [Verrucomicrobiae bacterium]